MKVLKFGGSCLSSTEDVERVKKIIEKQPIGSIVVFSSFTGVTNQLLEIANRAVNRDEAYKSILKEIRAKHKDFALRLIQQNSSEVEKTIEALLDELKDVVKGIYLLKDLSNKTLDYILSFGERLSAYIIANSLSNAAYVDALELIRTNSQFGNAKVLLEDTTKLFAEKFKINRQYPVFAGFIGSDINGNITTLGRGGGDYSASVIAAAVNASQIEIWTDLDGFMTADPAKVEKAYAIDHLSYAEAMELSHFGASVIYAPTIQPVHKRNIPIAIKNIFKPNKQGTIVSNEAQLESEALIKGISSIENIVLISLQGAGLVGKTGLSNRLFFALAQKEINVILITQASSEYSISFAISQKDAETAVKTIKTEFENEIELKNEIHLQVEDNLSIIAIVGEKMKNTPGISAALFSALAGNGISAVATAQGSSELNISVVIKKKSLKKALNSIHEGFFLSHLKDLHLYLVGVGTVGSSLISQINSQAEKLAEKHRLNIKVVGIARSKKMLVNPGGIPLQNYLEALEQNGEPTDHQKYIEYISELNLRNSIFVDCTAEESIAALYHDVLDCFCSVVTANKIACSSKYEKYRSLHDKASEKGVKFKYETNVGAGLPIISTLNDLVRSGDKILGLEAVLSGTLNFIFNEIGENMPMSETIRVAKEKGYSEPDPRLDLSGTDVARKILILARECGIPLEPKDLEVKKFLPEKCFEGSLDDFWQEVKKLDATFEEKRKALENEGKRWRYVAKFEDCKGTVELVELDKNHPAYKLDGSNNIILIFSERYKEQPMLIQGYGAGAEVTAAGVFADIIRIMNI
jgi:bifunctional aspartokinase / homoserine dehydrogenase 1